MGPFGQYNTWEMASVIAWRLAGQRRGYCAPPVYRRGVPCAHGPAPKGDVAQVLVAVAPGPINRPRPAWVCRYVVSAGGVRRCASSLMRQWHVYNVCGAASGHMYIHLVPCMLHFLISVHSFLIVYQLGVTNISAIAIQIVATSPPM